METMEKNSILLEAKQLMKQAHKGQTRWDGRSYEIHPEKVVQILQDLRVTDEIVLCAGYLHDILEDTNISSKELWEQFGGLVVELVEELTFKEGLTDREYQLQCIGLSDDAKLIKVADILANISDKGKKSEHFLQKRTVALVLMLSRLLKI